MESCEDNFRKKIAERELKQKYDWQIHSLGLDEERICQADKILDIGAGKREFAAYCLKNKLNDNVYSIDLNVGRMTNEENFIRKNWPDVSQKIGEKTAVSDRQKLPFGNDTFDLIINCAAMPAKASFKKGDLVKMQMLINDFLEEIIRVLKSGGEARLFPVEVDIVDQDRLSFYAQYFKNRLERMKRHGLCNFRFEEVEKNLGGGRGSQKFLRVVIKKS